MAKATTKGASTEKKAPSIKVKTTKRGVELITPAGVASYPRLNKPGYGTKEFPKPDGEYSVNLLYPSDSKECKALMAVIDEQHKASEQKAIAESKKKKSVKLADPPYAPETDEDGEPTGNMAFKFKLKASYTPKDTDGKLDKKGTIHFRPALFDAKGNPIKATIAGGSLLKIATEITPWYVASTGAGVKLEIQGVQVLDLVKFGGTKSFSFCGFDVEDGYSVSEDVEEEDAADEDSDDDDTEEDEDASDDSGEEDEDEDEADF